MLGLISELDVVNKILAVAGDTPVQTLEDEYIQAQLARQILTRVSRDVQSMTWWFNEEQCVTLTPDVGGLITLPTNAIAALAIGDGGTIVQRGSRIYNREGRTYVFTAPIEVDLVLALDWTELPQSARTYIADVACEAYNNEFFGAQEIKGSLARNIEKSYLILKTEDTSARDVNLLDNHRSASIAFRNRRG